MSALPEPNCNTHKTHQQYLEPNDTILPPGRDLTNEESARLEAQEYKLRNLKIMVGMPCTNEVTTAFATLMLGPLSFRQSWGIRTASTCKGYSLPEQRNRIVETLLEDKTASYLLWVDSDNIPDTPSSPNNALAMLYLRDVPIVSGVYRLKRKGFPVSYLVDSAPDMSKEEYFEVKYTGLGFCLVKREVYEKVPPPWFVGSNVSGVAAGAGEDTYFCDKVRKYGYKVMVDCRVQLSHIGFLILKPDGSIGLLNY
jgi:hypothetical protein